ncbi:MAG TPA: ABC transporter substrate-binding protein [Clostridia bacterium]|nr:ABC transporter substrate-binding protein [Clostridia bacterium]
MKKSVALLVAMMMIVALISACADSGAPTTPPASAPVETSMAASPEPTQAAGGPKYGGVLKATVNNDPASFDAMLEGAETEQVIASHIFETALACDRQGNPQPCVCTYELSEDGNVITLSVRDGVKFHNGDVCDIYDVEASANRWMNNVKFSKTHVVTHLESMAVVDGKLVFTFNSPAPLALTAISAWDRGLYIMPKELCEKYPDTKIPDAEAIGTGPYKFSDHQPDRFVLLEKFADYAPFENEFDGIAGTKHAYVDQLYFYPVSDKTARITGVQTGEYDVGIGVPSNMIVELEADANLSVEIKDLGIMSGLIFNYSQGPCSDVNLRNAILACLDMDELMLAAQGDESLYYLNPSVMPIASKWHTDENLGKYNNVNFDTARDYLSKSSYNGETLVFITTKEYDYFYKTALLVAEMVKEAGINVEVQTYDNATLQDYRMDPAKYDMFSSGLTAKADPSLIAFMEEGWAGLYSSEKKSQYYNRLITETDFDARYQTWVEMTKVLYEELPIITFGERSVAVVTRNYVHNLFDTTQKYYWNTWVD